MTDAASFRRTSRYVVTSSGDGDEFLERALPPYLRRISSDRAAKQVTDRRDHSLRIWRLTPDAVTDYELPGLQRQGDTPLSERYGTFSRSVARDRPDLNFFAVGHPLVDALGVALHRHVRGRSFLARLRTAAAEPGVVMLSAWRVGGLHLDGSNGVSELALRQLGRRVVWVAVDLTTGDVLGSGVVPKLIAALIKGEGAVDLDRQSAFKGFDIESDRWPATVNGLVAEAAKHAQAVYRTKFGEKDALFCKQLIRDAEEVSRRRPDEGDNYARQRRVTADAVIGATLDLDVVGLLKVESPT